MTSSAWVEALPAELREMQDRAPVLLVFLRHFG
jgi:hypothetical protein